MKVYYSSAYKDNKKSEFDTTYIVRLISYLAYLNTTPSEILFICNLL